MPGRRRGRLPKTSWASSCVIATAASVTIISVGVPTSTANGAVHSAEGVRYSSAGAVVAVVFGSATDTSAQIAGLGTRRGLES
jgi:hypothetical protein